MPQNSLKALPIRIVNGATLGPVYTSLNAPGFPESVHFMVITNNTDQDMLISYDGVATHDIVLAHDKLYLLPQLCAIPNNKEAIIKKWTQVYGSVGGAATGEIYIVAYYV